MENIEILEKQITVRTTSEIQHWDYLDFIIWKNYYKHFVIYISLNRVHFTFNNDTTFSDICLWF